MDLTGDTCGCARIGLYRGTEVRFRDSQIDLRTYQRFSEHGGARIGILTICCARIECFRDLEVRFLFDMIP